jgi:hypothetical protein
MIMQGTCPPGHVPLKKTGKYLTFHILFSDADINY